MALTATAQSALPPPLSWDETIVPALRKRLESESIMLSKRLSNYSNLSGDEGSSNYHTSSRNNTNKVRKRRSRSISPGPVRSTQHDVNHPRTRPSNIPRPSLQYSRPSISQETPAPRTPTPRSSSSTSRSRTLSQPYPYDPNQTPRKTRPKNGDVASTTHSTTSHAPNGRVTVSRNADVINGYSAANDVYRGQNGLTAITDDGHRSISDLSVESGHKQGSRLLHEPAPFNSSAYNSSVDAVDAKRPSIDEERPFEHWYRGDVSRNGGVGELRVGSRREMLDIANYGHRFNGTSNKVPGVTRRPRAGSIAAPERDSFYIDENAYTSATQMVLDETPLTDIEGDTDTERGTSYDGAVPNWAPAVPDLPPENKPHQPFTSRIPTPTALNPVSAVNGHRSASEPTTTDSHFPSTTPTPSAPPSPSFPHSQKRERSKSTTKSPGPPAKKANHAAKKPQKKPKSTGDENNTEHGRSAYPEPRPSQDGLADAIPTWTQPVRTGNWDDVVLPVVARKMGLADQYVTANGKTQAAAREFLIAPAPGTFGYDHSKYRPPRHDDELHGIPLNEFGQQERPGVVSEMDEFKDMDMGDGQELEIPESSSTLHQEKKNRPMSINTKQLSPSSPFGRRRDSGPPSPAPFSDYTALPPGQQPMVIGPPQSYVSPPTEPMLEEKEAGCCRCIIM